jgi:hypothetical protein
MYRERLLAVSSHPHNGQTVKGGATGEWPENVRSALQDAIRAHEAMTTATAECTYRLTILAGLVTSCGGGSRLLEACAAALNITRQALHPYVLVAARWPLDDLGRTLRRRDVLDRCLSGSHVHLLARLPYRARQECIERVLCEGLSVRQLRDLILKSSRR